jgi:X-X-X-Leu-X-X-Gly heptad repeat protein
MNKLSDWLSKLSVGMNELSNGTSKLMLNDQFSDGMSKLIVEWTA